MGVVVEERVLHYSEWARFSSDLPHTDFHFHRECLDWEFMLLQSQWRGIKLTVTTTLIDFKVDFSLITYLYLLRSRPGRMPLLLFFCD